MRENLLKHLRVWLATTFIGSPGDIEVILPAIGPQHPIKTTARLARGHRQTVALGAKHLKRLHYTVEQR
ncbi:hypothetical protein D3C80_1951890 [compost metagenome]